MSSTLLSDNNIIQVIPPPVKFGVNYDAFDNALGLCEGVLRLQILLGGVSFVVNFYFLIFLLKNFATLKMTTVSFGRKVGCSKVTS